MIRHISIKNFAIIKNINIDFSIGFSPITGETGAGKSIIIEAITMALGGRADKTFVRTGENKAVIQLVSEVDGEETILYREISKDGRSICKVNGEIVTLMQQREFSKQIADIHGQYAHQSLLDCESHITLVDDFMADQLSEAKSTVSRLFFEYSKKTKDLNSFLSSKDADEKERDYLEYQLGEIEKINPQADEDISLEEEIRVLENRDSIFSSLDSSYHIMYENEQSLLGELMSITRNLESINGIYEPSKELHAESLDIYYRLEALAHSIRESKDQLPDSYVSIDELINRLESINTLKRKHGGSLNNVLEFKENATLTLSTYENREEHLATLEKAVKLAEEELKAACIVLSKERKKKAKILEEKISTELIDLNFKDGGIKILFTEKDSYSENGIDLVEFLIKTNKGDTFKPLAKIASGGEISRVMLAFKKIVGDYDNIPTIIFDEVDTGISGQTASVVGRKLLEIGKSRQVIAITHLPQVAAFGDTNYAIVKKSDETSTFTEVIQLTEDEKIYEIARLLSGDEVTPSSLENAKSLVIKN